MTDGSAGPASERACQGIDGTPRAGRSAQFVVKISKYCNLRCTYCYEFDHLGDKARMSLDSIERMLANIAAGAGPLGLERVEFIWHGGEPLLIPLAYYDEIARLEQRILGPVVPYTNTLQTNLTVLTQAHLDWLEAGTFTQTIGVSFDAGGTQRVDIQGRNSADRTLANMQTLIDHDIGFGAICVMTRETVSRAAACYRFFDACGITSRILPFYRARWVPASSRHALEHDDLVAAMCAIFDAWRTSENATPVDPIDEYLGYAVRYIGNAPKAFYEPVAGDGVHIVNTDGETWGHADAYEPGNAYGNLFQQSLAELHLSPARLAAAEGTRRRMERHCGGCEFHGACTGFPVAESTADQQADLDAHGCPVRAILAHMVATMHQGAVFEWLKERQHSLGERAHLTAA